MHFHIKHSCFFSRRTVGTALPAKAQNLLV
jgi:hypothetical protein